MPIAQLQGLILRHVLPLVSGVIRYPDFPHLARNPRHGNDDPILQDVAHEVYDGLLFGRA
jgi:hypothetical protein